MGNLVKDIYRFLSPKWQNAFLDYKVDLRPSLGKDEGGYSSIINDVFATHDNGYVRLLESFLNYKEEVWRITALECSEDKTSPYWQNGFLPGLDMITLYGFIRIYQPAQYVEIGSGHSTKVAYKAIQEGELNTSITSIDPMPRAEINDISNHIIRSPVESLSWDNEIFSSLKAGDILFIDSSHRILPNSDCAFIYNELIPRLPSGVIIHIHDIYLPYDYPQFMCDRMYNENQVLAAYFLSNPEYFDVLLPNFYIHKSDKLSKHIAPIFDHENMKEVERHGGSIWLRKN